MAITYGFFNAIDSDRVYNADQMSEYFDGLVSNGVYEKVGNALRVTAGTGMAVNVLSGRGIIECKWIKNDAAYEVTLTAAHVLLARYTAIVLRLDRTNRLITIAAKDGTPASSPARPTMTDDGTVKELCLAYVYVGPNVTSITQANIIDMRASNLCGWVTGVVQQVDTSELFAQWQSAYEAYYSQMQSWQAQVEADFDEWFSALTSQLSVITYIQRYKKRVVLSTGSSTPIALDMTGYEYTEDDIIEVYINGLYADEGIDYTLTISGSIATVTPTPTQKDTVVVINATKSRIGYRVIGVSGGAALVTANNLEFAI